jgi:hypothetical protein
MKSRLDSRKVGITLAGLLLCGTLPGIALAQEPSKSKDTVQNFPIDDNNPCFNAEHFSGSGTLQTREEDSPNKSKFRSHLEGQAVNDLRTASYHVLEMTEREFITTSKSSKFEFEDRNHFIRDGKTKSAPNPKDDYFERSRTTAVNGTVTRREVRIECK